MPAHFVGSQEGAPHAPTTGSKALFGIQVTVLVVNGGVGQAGRFSSDIILRTFDPAVYGDSMTGQHRDIGIPLPQGGLRQVAIVQVVSIHTKHGGEKKAQHFHFHSG
ncbi:MAG: hypothetical protein Q9221_002792 [Calogaya cf. arnoldii]